MAQIFKLNVLEDMTTFMGFGDDHLSIVTEKTLHTKYDSFSPNATTNALKPHYAKVQQLINDDLPEHKGNSNGKDKKARNDRESLEKRQGNSAEQLTRGNQNSAKNAKSIKK